MSNSPSKGTALVTGASRGIGAVYADRLAKRGYDLILVGRSEAPLKALTASLASASGRHISAIVADLNSKTDLAKVETEIGFVLDSGSLHSRVRYRTGDRNAYC